MVFTPGSDGNGGSQREQAYQRLRHLLLLQQIPAGDRLRETQWSERLKVNRAALREALARLEAEGFVVRGPKAGYFVPVLQEKDVRNITEVRIILEGGAIDRIIERGLNTESQLAAMRECCEQLAQFAREDHLPAVPRSDRRFHEALVETARNRRFLLLYQRAPLPLIHLRLEDGRPWAERVQRTLAEHRAILAAIVDGQATQAKRLLREHLTIGAELVTEVLRQSRSSRAR
jgi:DNA-binding GntR family transcriptional regulator